MKKSGENLGEAKSIFENLNKLSQEEGELEFLPNKNENNNNIDKEENKENDNEDESYFTDLIKSCSKGHEL